MNRLKNFLNLLKTSPDDTRLEQLNAQIESQPNLASAYYQRGILLAGEYMLPVMHHSRNEQNDVPQAIADFNHAIELDPNLVDAYYQLANLYFALDIDDHTAQELLEAALNLAPNNIDCLLLYADLICCEGVNAYAIEILDRVIGEDPSAKHFFYKARTLMDNGEIAWNGDNFAQGGSLFQAAIEIFQQVMIMEDSEQYQPEAHEYINHCQQVLANHVYH
ncbi:hypothetical protein VII00023_09249 [Vibrio ichthyoenteri ATCC 700023]|uniref:Uncharacterized protein n=1 Tax=Vibrio ichthyoenteri ATCC 700023 TaxID=870968 RepID=F9S8U9_9VIBR|nr:tetratricopeptide repeat protein [Vibrio ichthyoenteri]EGU29586.1 hypothetical protein VII00023_09249 [Vibrio ichthyoenteri ATCC 700023]